MAKAPRLNFSRPTVRVSRRRSVIITDVDNLTPLLRDMRTIKEAVVGKAAADVKDAVRSIYGGQGLNPPWAANTQLTQMLKSDSRPMSDSGELATTVEVRRNAPGFDLAQILGPSFVANFVGWFEDIHMGTTTSNPHRIYPNVRRTPPLSRAQLAAVHEFGLPKERALGRPRAAIPARPWLTQAADELGPLILEKAVVYMWGLISLYAVVRPPKTPLLAAQGRANVIRAIRGA